MRRYYNAECYWCGREIEEHEPSNEGRAPDGTAIQQHLGCAAFARMYAEQVQGRTLEPAYPITSYQVGGQSTAEIAGSKQLPADTYPLGVTA
jgi:hypothetical protein